MLESSFPNILPYLFPTALFLSFSLYRSGKLRLQKIKLLALNNAARKRSGSQLFSVFFFLLRDNPGLCMKKGVVLQDLWCNRVS